MRINRINLPGKVHFFVSPHAYGLLGDTLNLLGGGILVDAFRRERELRKKEGYGRVSAAARKAGVTSTEIEGYPANLPDLGERILNRDAFRRACVGVGFMAFGFALQAVYHVMAMLEGAPPQAGR